MASKTTKTASKKAAYKTGAPSKRQAKAALVKPATAKAPQSDVVRARIDRQLKKDASLVLAAMGLTASDAYRMMMIRIATEKALPFNPLVPNKETIQAMEAARRGEVVDLSSISELFE